MNIVKMETQSSKNSNNNYTYQWKHNLVKMNIVKLDGLLALLSIVGWWKWKDSMVGWWMQSHSM